MTLVKDKILDELWEEYTQLNIKESYIYDAKEIVPLLEEMMILGEKISERRKWLRENRLHSPENEES